MSHLDDPYRLPRSVRPRRYEVVIEPDLTAGSFAGTVTIDADVLESVSEVVLNSDDLAIEEVRVAGSGVPHALHPDTERLVLTPDAPLPAGRVSIEITFRGKLNDKLRGFYRSTYVDADGREQVIATTQMQSTDCRSAFPCFDEPEMKSVFAISLIVDPAHLAISNSPEIGRTDAGGGKVRIDFADTIPMSSYLVAFVVGPLEATAPVRAGSVDLRIVHVPGKGHLAEYGLKAAAFALEWFERYYGIDYPGPKIDLVAVPDFAFGAMENFGCITFREVLLLIDPEKATLAEKQVLVDVVAHELSHMWFGDMVTMRWWNGIWLNEAFATFMEVAATEAFAPDWKRWTAFATERTAAMEVDALRSTRPVEFEVRSPEDCEGMFDVLTYEKGGSLLRMLEQYVGAERFRLGVGHYLSRHMYGSTETNDLWDDIESKVNEIGPDRFEVRAMMDSWIWQPGFPLVSASIVDNEVILRQQRFSYEPDADQDPTLWHVPVTVAHGGSTTTVLLDGREARVPLTDPGAPVVVNSGGWGYFRVAYDDVLLARLTPRFVAGLTELERYNLVDDGWNALVAGRTSRGGLVSLLGNFSGEQSPVVWQAIVRAIQGLWRLVADDELDSVAALARQLAGPLLAELGWTPAANEPELRSKTRGIVVSLLGVVGADETVRAKCREIVEIGEGDPEVVAAATVVAASCGSADDFERHAMRFRHADTPQEEMRFLYSLAEFPGEDQIRRAVSMALSDEVRTQNGPILLFRCLMNRRQGALAWSLVKDRWAEVVARFPSNIIIRIASATKDLTAPELVSDVQRFFAENPLPQSAKTLEQTLERQRINAALRAREFVSG